ncbi:hypothetical protein [Stenotrophomonas sp. YIM B06876]|uniref:hypothetical protein n=1 Tax=Stenotrophomonas sp. YIM B06876 TaxID=3060211 RepID=UPI0027396828|nr:hypothetical protein [Stenotrophomonas sp. YIM B06876]
MHILDTTDTVFGEHGRKAARALVIERAVGPATRQRNFPGHAGGMRALRPRAVPRGQGRNLRGIPARRAMWLLPIGLVGRGSGSSP